jgi:glucokinase
MTTARQQVIAIDVGGTKLSGALVDGDGRLDSYQQTATPTAAHGEPDTVWPALAGLVDALARAAAGPLLGLGVGSAGPIDLNAGTVSPVNILSWRGFPLARHLAEHTGLPVRLAGDGICAAVGEHWLGAARGLSDVLVMVVSTGVGGGLIQRGRLHAGRTGNAGHIGHMVVDLDGDPCPCGGRGCVEALASGPSMVNWALRQGWQPVGGPADGVRLAESARTGDQAALGAFERSGRAVAAGITSMAAANDLSHAVVGGGVARADDLLLPPLRAALAEYARLDFLKDLVVRTAELGGRAGLLGAAALVFAPDRYGGTASPQATPVAAPG